MSNLASLISKVVNSNGGVMDGRSSGRWNRTIEIRSFAQSIVFSSNDARSFGRLLTPLVEGIRIAGPFSPAWNPENSEQPKASVTGWPGDWGIRRILTPAYRLKLLVVTQSPMRFCLWTTQLSRCRPAPCSALGSLAISGNASKLIICFTHFDEVHGDKLT